MWRKIFKLFGFKVVVTCDFDGEVRYRFAKSTPFGMRACAILPAWELILNEDGTCSGKDYVKKWKLV